MRAKVKKKVVISGKVLCSKTNGIPRYAQELIKHLDSLFEFEKFDIDLIVPVDIDVSNIPKLDNISVVKKGKKCHGWDLLYAEPYAAKEDSLLLNFAGNGGLYKNSIRCIHDIRPLSYDICHAKKTKKTALYKLNFYLATNNNKAIVTVSDFCRDEISRYFKKDIKSVNVFPEGWEHINDIKDIHLDIEPKSYYFSIGSLAPHKNFEWVLEVAKNNPESKFIISGGINNKIWNYNIDFNKVKNVEFIGYISDEEMKAYMKNAKALLFPSLYEGFGIPPLEALALGTPVIASNISVLHEIYANSIHYVDPMEYDYNLDSILSKPVDSAEAILEKESWNKCAEMWHDLILKNI